jgi:hypothetical protein
LLFFGVLIVGLGKPYCWDSNSRNRVSLAELARNFKKSRLKGFEPSRISYARREVFVFWERRLRIRTLEEAAGLAPSTLAAIAVYFSARAFCARAAIKFPRSF